MGHHDLATDKIEQRLLRSEAAIAKERADQMALLRELDRRQTPMRDGYRSLKEWATGRLDIAPETASALVSTAHRLGALPEVSNAVASGVIGFDRAAAVSRFAGRDDACDILDQTAGYDIAGIRRLASRRRRMSRLDEEVAFDSRYLVAEPNLDESAWRFNAQLPGATGRIVIDALDAKADSFPNDPEDRSSRAARNADALWAIAIDSLEGGDGATIDTGTPLLTVFIDASEASRSNGETGVTVEAGPQVGPHTIEAILCDGIIEVTAQAGDGTPLAVGRRSRIIPPRLRRFVLHRDGAACTVAGCVSRYRLQIHHIQPWAEGGRTDPENLTTLCWFHHHIVIHGQGFAIDPSSPPRKRRLLQPRIHAPPQRTAWRAA